ncbi:cation:proton antiporter [Arthrobacter alpinus]|nr:cation:proton antiporter [Arthrobacter alpinus]
MTFHVLALICFAALLGPLLALPRRWHIPVVIGELAAGILIGRSGLNLLDPAEPTFTFLADLGFALVMFVAGSHVPVRDQRIHSALGSGMARLAVVAVAAAAVGIAVAGLFGTGHASLYVVLLASSSAALVLPIIGSVQLRGPQVLAMTAQVAIADTLAIVALPWYSTRPRPDPWRWVPGGFDQRHRTLSDPAYGQSKGVTEASAQSF